MRLTVTLVAIILPTLAYTYQIAFTGPNSEEDGYEYTPAITPDYESLSRLCLPTPLFEDGPLEVLVRARSPGYDGPIWPFELRPDIDSVSSRPVPAYIALYSGEYTLAGPCNPRALEQIIAFDATAQDVQLVAKIASDDVTYWREIADTAAAEEEAATGTLIGRLIDEYRLAPGDMLVRLMDGDWRADGDWEKIGDAVTIFGYNDDIFAVPPLQGYQLADGDMAGEEVAEEQRAILNEGDNDMTEVLDGSRWPRLTYKDLAAGSRNAVRVRPAQGDLLGEQEDLPDFDEMDEYANVLGPIATERQEKPSKYLPWQDYLPEDDESPLLSPRRRDYDPPVR
ncbi:hypothetical protein TWF696_004923 [Orbilia brochopaga]|uniref:Uncharacterized protein n=1 Tax=Orbilia brochopaga TaxID=3140254 RepID=A0AAV9V2G0_9PEZI